MKNPAAFLISVGVVVSLTALGLAAVMDRAEEANKKYTSIVYPFGEVGVGAELSEDGTEIVIMTCLQRDPNVPKSNCSVKSYPLTEEVTL